MERGLRRVVRRWKVIVSTRDTRNFSSISRAPAEESRGESQFKLPLQAFYALLRIQGNLESAPSPPKKTARFFSSKAMIFTFHKEIVQGLSPTQSLGHLTSTGEEGSLQLQQVTRRMHSPLN